ncbi:MAG TPA: cytochrome c [Gemmatimonadales bacterium]|nr:cytochrome c [Gemmatimonadales bacterium]
MGRGLRWALALVGLIACNPDDVVHRVGWFSTMRHQRSIRPYAQPIPPPEGAIPVTGAELPVTRDNADRLVNPRARTAESLNRGKLVYEIQCQVCHGPEGKGDGPVSFGGGGPLPGVPPLVDDARRRLSDGHIYGVIRDAQAMGKGLMPQYGWSVRGTDRWDVVNYVRTLQAQAAAGAAR